ncbi:uncharacterized protein LOC143274996 [Babylonia areolata]|uniref:uncharacterized protein LOC143274996 n=1 Tax=Babylonia areolata TaxID=304850 RepID=UPI003FD3C8AC
MKAVAVCLLVCCGVLVSAQEYGRLEAEYTWNVSVLTYSGKYIQVRESTQVYSNRVMVTNASDPNLVNTVYYRAQILHDFQNKKMAVNPFGSNRCYVADLKNNFKKTENMLKKRNNRTVNSRKDKDYNYIIENETAEDSEYIVEFCRRKEQLVVIKELPTPEPVRMLRLPPLYCMFGPIIIWFPIESRIFLDEEVPEDIREWIGPFSPSL